MKSEIATYLRRSFSYQGCQTSLVWKRQYLGLDHGYCISEQKEFRRLHWLKQRGTSHFLLEAGGCKCEQQDKELKNDADSEPQAEEWGVNQGKEQQQSCWRSGETEGVEWWAVLRGSQS